VPYRARPRMSDRLWAEPRVSVVIPTFERRDALRRLLDALERQSLPPSAFEVVVAVDGSQDGTLEMLESFASSYPLQWVSQTNRGRAAACNAAIRRARGQIVVIFDDDMEPAPECLEAHSREHDPQSRRCVMGASPIAVEQGAPAHVRYVAAKFAEHLERLAEPGHCFQIRDFYSGNVSAPRRELVAVGLFEESFRDYGNEDLELAHRLVANGVALAYSADAIAVQRYHKSLRQLASDELAKGRTAVLFASMHPDALPGLKLTALRGQRTRRRAVRRGLLWATQPMPRVSELVLAVMRVGNRFAPLGAQGAYRFALEYFYMLGAELELRRRSSAVDGHGPEG
jgi:glycosyltransferase involved in cell wall biosynthesis